MKAAIYLSCALLISFTISCKTVDSASSGSNNREGSGPVVVKKISTDNTYGVTSENPVHVGGVVDEVGPAMERKYLDQLEGPNGEELTYERTGSCCSFDTPRGFMGSGLLDKYAVSYDGLDEPIIIYIDMYDYETVMAPKGFTIAD